MIVVSGCPRSGTSMMMRIMESVFGEDRILGEKEPQKQREPERTEIQQYLYDKQGRSARRDRAKKMNPNGYYEMAFSVQGVYYRPQFEDMLRDLLTDEGQRTVCKIVSQGLAQSDPRYIDKIIFMVRHPYAVATSQKNLSRDNPMTPEMAPERNGEKVLIRTVQMFNQVTISAAQWIQNHPEIPAYIVNYDDLLDYPQATLAQLEAFLGEGDFSQAHTLIDQTLRRSAPDPMEDKQAAFAMALYERLLVGDWAGIIAARDAKIADMQANPPKPTRWYCPRLDEQVTDRICELCHNHVMTRDNLKRNAIRKKTKWKGEPCPYECGIQGEPGMSVKDSIAQNHWSVPSESFQGRWSIQAASVLGNG